MKRIYVAEATWDAMMVRDLLATSGIDAEVLLPHGPVEPVHIFAEPTITQSVWVLNDEDEGRAVEIVRAFKADASSHSKDSGIVWKWRCETCREDVEPQFEVCWNCGTERPVR
jgi:hypothetical protein